MSENMSENKSGRYLKNTRIGKYTLLNSEKLRRVLDLMEGITEPANSEEGRILKEALALKDKNMGILSLYDRLGGGIREGERKLKVGTFFDFKARKPRVKPEIDEDDYEDEYVLTRKRQRRSTSAESESERIARIQNDSKNGSDDVEEENINVPDDSNDSTEEANTTEEVKASEAAIKKAEELGVDIATVKGTGAGGNIKVSDVEAAAEAKDGNEA